MDMSEVQEDRMDVLDQYQEVYQTRLPIGAFFIWHGSMSVGLLARLKITNLMVTLINVLNIKRRGITMSSLGNQGYLSHIVEDPTVAPVLNQVADATAKLGETTHYVAYSWTNEAGETKVSPTASIKVEKGSLINVSIPQAPDQVTGVRVYASQLEHKLLLQGSSTESVFVLRQLEKGIEPVKWNTTETYYSKVDAMGSGRLKGAIQNVTSAGSRVRLPSFACKEVTIIAKDTNTGVIYAGGSDVSSSVYGVKLKADGSFTFPVSNASMIYIDASASGEGISYIAI
jgi:hypothetical protein